MEPSSWTKYPLLYGLFSLASSLAGASEARFTLTDFEDYCESDALPESARATLEIIREGRSCAETFVALSTSGPSLDLSGKGIRDLTPLKFFPRLSYVNLSGNQIEDLSPLQDFNRLRELNISNNRVISLLPLADSQSLRVVKADGNDIESIANLRSDSLEELSLNDNLLVVGGVNFSFAKFPNLKAIQLRRNGLRVFSFFLGDISDRDDLSSRLAVDLRENELTKEEQEFLQTKMPGAHLSFSPATTHLPSCRVCLPLVADSLESAHDLKFHLSLKKLFISYIQSEEVSDADKKFIEQLLTSDKNNRLEVKDKIKSLSDEYEYYLRKTGPRSDEESARMSHVGSEMNRLLLVSGTLSTEPGGLLSTESLTKLFRGQVRRHVVEAPNLKLESLRVLALLYPRVESLKVNHNRVRALDQLKSFHNLRFVDLSYNLIDNAVGLREMDVLERIDLSGNVLGSGFFDGVGSDELGSDSLWDLRLAKNGIDESTFDFTLLSEMKALQSIDLRQNDFSPEDFQVLRDEHPHLSWEPEGSVTLPAPNLVSKL